MPKRPDLDAMPDWLYALACIAWLIGYTVRVIWKGAVFCLQALWELGGLAVYLALGITALAAGIIMGL